MTQKVGSTWSLNKYGECIPGDEGMCNRLANSGLSWNKEKNKCEYADAD